MRSASLRRITLAGALALTMACAAPSVAAAASPLTGLTTTTTTTATAPAAPAVTTATSTTANSSTGTGGLTTIEVLGIAVAVLAVFGAIFYAIRSDARSHTPRGDATLDIDRERGTVTPRADRVRRSRAKAKAARKARRAGR
jgi:hypothetical protein